MFAEYISDFCLDPSLLLIMHMLVYQLQELKDPGKQKARFQHNKFLSQV